MYYQSYIQAYSFGRNAGAIILKISHGYTIEPKTADPLVELADEALIQFSLAAQPGAWLVDVLPTCKPA